MNKISRLTVIIFFGMYPVKLICDKRFRERNNGHAIGIQYCYSSSERTVCPAEIYIPFECWNRRHRKITDNLPPEYGDAASLNEKLLNLTRIVEDLIKIAEQRGIHPLKFVKDSYRPDLNLKDIDEEYVKKQQTASPADSKEVNLSFFFQIDDYIKSRLKKVSADMPRIFRNMRDHLKEFEEFRGIPITFEGLDLGFYEELVDYLIFDHVQKRRTKNPVTGLRVNTVGKTIRLLRTFLRNRIRRNIIPEINMDGWDILEEEIDAIYLNWTEISLIYNADLSNYPQLIPYRNDLVFSCLTGLRFSDFSTIEEIDLRGDLLFKKQQKTRKPVVIPLRPIAIKILKQRWEEGFPVLNSQVYNRYIKKIVRLAGITRRVKHSYLVKNKLKIEIREKCDWTSSHTGRRSFCTNEFLAGTPVELIMKISGHKTTKAFYKYIRITPEEAAIRVKEIWEHRAATTDKKSEEQKFAYAILKSV